MSILSHDKKKKKIMKCRNKSKPKKAHRIFRFSAWRGTFNDRDNLLDQKKNFLGKNLKK